MRVALIGAGCGVGSLTQAALDALRCADTVIGAARLLAALPQTDTRPDCRRTAAVKPEEILAALEQGGASACVLLSGDSGFYSGAARLLPLLEEQEVQLLPGISSVQLLAARLGQPWQDWRLCSAHGRDCDPVAELCCGKSVFFLTGGSRSPAELCRMLTDAGLGEVRVTVGENLGLEDEHVSTLTASQAAEGRFAPLSVLLAEPAPRPERRAPGLPDERFARLPGVPMTKREIRAAALSLLAVGPEDMCWDIGAGTGSVSVELALQAKAVWAVERDEAALALAEQNRRALGAWNLRLVAGQAPEALTELPRPDAVFVGGSGGRLPEILRAVHTANPKARVCVSALALETLQQACDTLNALGYAWQVTQLAVSRSKAVGSLHLMLAQNPVFLILGEPV